MTFAEINKYYGTPAQRGLKVRCDGKQGRITIPAPRGNHYINVRWDGDKRSTAVYPLDLDYLVDGEWQLGKDLLAVRDAKIDAWNKRMNGD